MAENTRLNITYNQIVELFSNACSAHVGINQFDTGTIDYLDASAVNKSYPYVFLRPVTSLGLDARVRTLSFELFSLDVPKLSNESPTDVMSNMELILYDLLSYVNFGNEQQTYEITMTGLTPVNEAFQDRVYGWVANIDVRTPYVQDFCNYPSI